MITVIKHGAAQVNTELYRMVNAELKGRLVSHYKEGGPQKDTSIIIVHGWTASVKKYGDPPFALVRSKSKLKDGRWHRADWNEKRNLATLKKVHLVYCPFFDTWLDMPTKGGL